MQLRPLQSPPTSEQAGVETYVVPTSHAGDGLCVVHAVAPRQLIFFVSGFVMIASSDMSREARELIETSRTETVIETSLQDGQFRIAVYQPRFMRSAKPAWFMMNHATARNVRADWDLRSQAMVFTSTRHIPANGALVLYYGSSADRLFCK